jgi:hypothetical protein
VSGLRGFTCPRCGLTSYHPKDVEHRHCGNCEQFFPTDTVWEECERCHLDYERDGSMVKQENGSYRCIYCDRFGDTPGIMARR